LFNTSVLACSRSGGRRTDFVVVRFLREFRFMTGGFHATRHDRIWPRNKVRVARDAPWILFRQAFELHMARL
jgi:hypothetical protein